MTYLIDTNILLRYADRGSGERLIARNAVLTLVRRGETLVITSQNLWEFWAVATRPGNVNGLGMSIGLADRWLDRFERLFPLLPETADIHRQWRRLVMTYAVRGVQVHDARLAAAMLAHGVTGILTFNTTDFARFAAEGLAAVGPAAA